MNLSTLTVSVIFTCPDVEVTVRTSFEFSIASAVSEPSLSACQFSTFANASQSTVIVGWKGFGGRDVGDRAFDINLKVAHPFFDLQFSVTLAYVS
jgi:hypothetical protein